MKKMKSKNQRRNWSKKMKFLSYATMSFFLIGSLASCDKDEEPQDNEPVAQTVVLDCDMQGLDKFVHEDSTFVLRDLGSGVDYYLDCIADVEGDLIIEPGVTIELGSNGGFDVNYGSFNAVGTPEKPITFTGEDKVAGSWGYIVIKTDDVKNRMEHCILEYGGGFQVSSNGDKGNLVISHSSRMAIANCSFLNSEEYGVKVTASSAEITAFDNVTASGCLFPVHIPSNLVHMIQGGSFTGNTNDAILVDQTSNGTNVTVDNGNTYTWTKLDVPYRLGKNLKVQGGTLVIEPGVTMEFENGLGIDVGDSDASTLIADGTASDPILFTGVNKVAGSWNKIEFNFTQSPSNSISHAIFEYAGSDNGAIEMWADPVLSVTDVVFRNISSCAFYDNVPDFNPAAQVINPNLTWSNLSFSDIDNENGETDQAAFPGGAFSYCH